MKTHSLEVLGFSRVVKLLAKKCVTVPGRDRARGMQPEISLHAVEEMQRKLVEILAILESSERLPIGELENLTPLLSRSAVEGSALEPLELLSLSRSARMADDILRHEKGHHDDRPLLHAITRGLDPLLSLQIAVAKTIDTEGEVLDGASAELAAIRKEIEATRAEVRRILDGYLQSTQTKRSLQDSIITLRNGRYVLPVKGGDRRSVDGIVHDHSGSGATVFVEPIETVARNNALARLRQEEAREIRKILQALTTIVAEGAGALARNFEIIGEIDFLQAKGLLGKEWGATIPTLKIHGPLEIRQGRHPLLELSLAAINRSADLVPFEIAYPDECRSVVLTGPNTGGKTVALKTVGLFSLLAQCGMALPAGEGTRLPFFTAVHADIGDDQSIEKNLSSYSGHIEQVVNLLREVDDGTLVLIDEIGAGTDPAEGAALAMAIIEEVHARGATSLITTHLGSLKLFVHETSGMVNASMEFDNEKLRPTYRLEIGMPGTSHGLEIAERLGVPAAVVERARDNLGSDAADMEKLLADLKKKNRSLDELLWQTQNDREEIAGALHDLDKRERSLREEERHWKGRALEEAKRYLEESRSLVERHVKEIRTGGGERRTIREARSAIEAEREHLEEQIEALQKHDPPARGKDELAVGRFVHVESMNQTGKIVAKSNKPNRFYIEAGGLRLEVDGKDLAVVSRPGRRRAIQKNVVPVLREAKLEIDLRGMTAEEAVEAVDQFLDDAVLSGVGAIQIIHGIGTGVLRRTVQEMLAEDSRVGKTKLSRNGGLSVVEMND